MTKSATKQKFIFVVEDEPGIREVLCEILELEGYQTAFAANGMEALSFLEKGPLVDLILLDMTMPLMDGKGFREFQLKNAKIAAIPVFLMSAINDIGEKAVHLQVDAHIRKPIEIDQLLGTIKRFFEMAPHELNAPRK